MKTLLLILALVATKKIFSLTAKTVLTTSSRLFTFYDFINLISCVVTLTRHVQQIIPENSQRF